MFFLSNSTLCVCGWNRHRPIQSAWFRETNDFQPLGLVRLWWVPRLSEISPLCLKKTILTLYPFWCLLSPMYAIVAISTQSCRICLNKVIEVSTSNGATERQRHYFSILLKNREGTIELWSSLCFLVPVSHLWWIHNNAGIRKKKNFIASLSENPNHVQCFKHTNTPKASQIPGTFTNKCQH